MRCKRMQVAEGVPSSDDTEKAWQDKSMSLQTALAKIEAGEIGSLDSRGCFVCSICGQQGLGLLQIVEHEEVCRERLSQEGHVSPSVHSRTLPAEGEGVQQLTTCVAVAKELNLLKTEIAQEAAGDEESRALLTLTVDRLRDVARNACFLEEKKYRRLRLSNPAVSEAIGKWGAAKRILQALGFELVMHASKSGASPEPHLMLPGQLSSNLLQEFLDCLEGKTEVETEPKDTGSLEECKYCHRKFRFDRIAKHETRCPESKPKPAKLDVVRKLLQGTPGEQNIPAARQDFLSGKKLPPLPVKPTEPFSSTDVTTCRYSQHSRRTTPRHAASMPRESTPRHTPSTPREGTTPRQQSRGHRGGGGVAEASGRASRSRESRESKTEEVSALGRAAKGDRLARASRSLIKGVAQPSYDQLEVDVSNWLDD